MPAPSAESFISAATAVAESTPAESAPEPVVSDQNLANEPITDQKLANEPITDQKLAEEPIADQKPATDPAKVADKSPTAARVEKTLADVAREKVALRAEKEQLKQYQVLADAAKKGNAVDLMAAAGIKWKDAALQILESGKKQKFEDETPEEDPRDKRLAALENEIATTKATAARSNLMGQLKTLTKDTRFKHTAAFEAEHEAVAYIERYFNETGELPGENIQETMEIALEAVEAHYVKQAEKWAKVLTPGNTSSSVAGNKQAVPAAGAVSQQAARTLTNNVGAGPTPNSGATQKAKTEEEYILDAIQALTAQ